MIYDIFELRDCRQTFYLWGKSQSCCHDGINHISVTIKTHNIFNCVSTVVTEKIYNWNSDNKELELPQYFAYGKFLGFGVFGEV